MSGHSKWATIKHKKGAADKARGKLFTKLIRQVKVAARVGGGDPDTNPTLRTIYQKARNASVPIDTIERAIKRGTGELEGVTYEEITYEGYVPHGVAILIDVLTDNRNRTGSEIRTALKRQGGSIAEPGSVAWQFERKGVIVLPKSEEDDIMLAALDAGAEDLADEGDTWSLITAPTDLGPVRARPSRRTASPSSRPTPPCCRRRPCCSTPLTPPSRSFGSSMPWRTTTTSRTCSPTSTSPTTSWRRSRSRPDRHPGDAPVEGLCSTLNPRSAGSAIRRPREERPGGYHALR